MAEFFHAAHKYNCKDALKHAKNYMMKNINAQSSIICYEIAVLCDIPDLKEACKKVLFFQVFFLNLF